MNKLKKFIFKIKMQKDFENLNENKMKLNRYNLEGKNIKNEIDENAQNNLKSKIVKLSSTERDYSTLSDKEENEGNNYSIELIEEEEEEINSDEYISSTMLDVETNTYIDYSTTNNNFEKKAMKKSSTKNFKNFVKAININNNDYLNQNRKCGNSNSSHKNQGKKNDYIGYSPLNSDKRKSKFKKKIKNNKDQEKNENIKKDKKNIIYKKLNIKDIQNKKSNKNNKNKKNEKHNTKNYSLLEYNFPPLNNIYDEDLEIKNKQNNEVTKKIINENKNSKNKLKTDADMRKINKVIKHIRSPTLEDNNINKSKFFKEFLLKQKFNKDEVKKKKKNIFSPINNKKRINSLESLKTLNNINLEIPSSIINQFISKDNYNNCLTNNNLSNNSRTIISKNSKINKHIVNKSTNLNNFNKNINRINHFLFSPGRKKFIEKASNKKINSSYPNKIINSNSISVEKNLQSIINQNINKFSDRLLTYDFQDHQLLARNNTFKNKRHKNNKNKFLNLLINKKKIKLSQAKELLISSNKNPGIKMKIENKKKINLQNFKNKNKSNYHLLNNNSITNSVSNRKTAEQYQTINTTNNKNANKIINNKNPIKNNSKKYIYLQKNKPPNNLTKANISLKANKINPFIYQSFNYNKLIKRKILSQSKSKSKNKRDEKLGKKLDINMTSVNLTKKTMNKNAQLKKENIANKKKNRQRAKTLIEEDYLRDIIMSSINQESQTNNTFFKNDNNSKKEKQKANIYKSLNQLKNKSSYSSSVNDMIIKSPSQRNNINFNININMNNNNYKKLIYHYHGYHVHNKSSVNYSYANNTSHNVNKINKKKLKI